MPEKIKKIFKNFDREALLASCLGLISLGGCLVALIFANYNLAEIFAVWIYLFLLMATTARMFEFKTEPQKFAETVKSKTELVTQSAKNRRKIFINNRLWPSFGNIFVVIVYLLLFGAELPNQQNYYRFIILFLVLALINIISFVISVKGEKTSRADKSVSFKNRNFSAKLKTSLKNWGKQKNNIFIATINLAVVFIYLSVTGFNLSVNGSYFRFSAFVIILLVINLLAFIDITNERYN
ncbi:MAG: hypothetical protein WC768_03465 [Patescibacteria group bacterium]|jgi:MFS family permease